MEGLEFCFREMRNGRDDMLVEVEMDVEATWR